MAWAIASPGNEMKLPQRLASRIVLAFVLMTAVVAGGFALSLKLAIDWVELQLVSRSLERQLDFILDQDNLPGHRALGPDLRFYSYPRGATPATLPEFVEGRPPGFHEYERGGEAWHFLVRDLRDQRYVLLLDQYDFEQRENRLQLIVLIGFVVSVLLAWLLGHFLSRRAMAPVIRLAGQVQQREQLLPMAPPLAIDYDHDEVGRLASAFDATLGQLRAALERERLFTSDISHELRTPLMIIASSCELLESGALDDQRRRRLIRRIAEASSEMSTLVETFLELARSPARGGTRSSIDLQAAAQDQLARWQTEAEKRGLRLELAGAADPSARYPEPLLTTVLSNLVRNALHHGASGSVRLELRAYGFSVIDNGPGIAEGERERLFAPFARGNGSRGDGIGIGLSLVDRICRSAGWAVSIHTPPTGGCEFRVELARAAARST